MQEVTLIKDSYKKKAKIITEVLNSMENVKCNEVAGVMYAFPRITLPKKAIEAPPDNALRKLKFHCLNFPYFYVAKFHKSYRSSKRSLSQGFIEGFFEIQIFPLQGKYVCGLFGERSVRIMGGQK